MKKVSAPSYVRRAKRYAFLSSLGIAAPVSGRCLLCGKEQLVLGMGGLCGECGRKLTPNTGRTCEKCGRPLIAEENYCETCREHTRDFDKAYSCFVYEDAARMLVTQCKYGNGLYIARQMANDMAELYNARDISCSVIVPAPSSPERLKSRGYDHIAVIAEILGGIIHVPVIHGAVVKQKDNPAQAGLSGQEREKNVEGVYGRGANSKRLKGAYALIVDDVLTTGSTAGAIAKVVKRCGAKGVAVLTFASTRYSVISAGRGADGP